MENIQISKAEEKDFDKVYEIFMHEAVNPYMVFPVLPKEEFREIWKDIFNNLKLWKEGDEVMAVAVVTEGIYRHKHIAYISKLTTNQSLNKKGLGTIFVNEIISQLASRGFKRVELEAESDNLRAISFYLKLGFVAEGWKRNVLNREGVFVDNYSMAKFL